VSCINERTAERDEAVTLLDAAFSTIEAQGREPDAWERSCLAQGINAAYRGAYGMAATEADLALTPAAERSAQWKPSADVAKFTTVALWRALAEVAVEPAREFPHFGPIVSAGR